MEANPITYLDDVVRPFEIRSSGTVSLSAVPELSPGNDYRELTRANEQHDRVLEEQLRKRIDARVLKAVQDTARALEEGEKALAGAQARLDAHDARPVGDLAGISKRAAERGTIVGEVYQLQALASSRREAYHQAVEAARLAALPIVNEIMDLAVQQFAHDEDEYRRMREDTRLFLTTARARQDAAGRLWQRANSGTADLFR